MPARRNARTTRTAARSRAARQVRRAAALALFTAWACLCRQQAALAAGVLDAPLASVAVSAPAAAATRRFAIPAGPLEGALDAFRAASGLAVVVDAPPELVAALASPGCSGEITNAQALQALLDGTGLAGAITGRRAVVRAELVEEVAVESRAPTQLAQSSPKFAAPLREIPQSIDVVDAEVLAQQGATTLQDALRNVAGISLAAGEGSFQGDALTIRGFNARGDLHLDGMRDFGSYYRDPFALDEVQVLKGPSGLAFGRGSTGGVVNQATKLPRPERFGSTEAQAGSDGTRRLTLDLCEPLERLGPGAAVRVAAMAHEGGVAGRDVTRSSRWGVAPSLAFVAGENMRLTFAHLHQSADDVPDYGVPWLLDAPAEVPRGTYYGFEDDNRLETSVDVTTFRVEHEIRPGLSLRNQLRFGRSTREALITDARVIGTPTRETPLGDVIVRRGQVDARSAETILQDQLDVSASFETGRVRHALVAGVEAARETSSPVRRGWSGVPESPLLDADPGDELTGTTSITSDVDTTATTLAAYAVDTMRVTERLSFVAGLRWDRFRASSVNTVPDRVELERTDRKGTWRAAVVFQPTPAGSVYASASTSFNPSAEALALSAAAEDTAPERNRSIEAGAKWDLRGGRLHLRGAVFLTEKIDAREASLADPLRQVLAGRQRARGFEAAIDGSPTARWHLSAAYARTDSEVIDSKVNADAQGEPLANVPRHSFSAWSTHDLPLRLEVGWGVRHASSRTASSTAPRDATTLRLKEAPGYWVADAMVARPIGDRWALQLNLANLTDERYFDQVHGGHVVPGAGRSATLGARFHWKGEDGR